MDGGYQCQEVHGVNIGRLLERQIGIDGAEIYLRGNLAERGRQEGGCFVLGHKLFPGS